MRCKKVLNGLTINAIAGTYVVFFGLDVIESQRAGFRGFGFQRTDHTVNKTIWLRGTKTFQKTEPNPAPGETFSTRYHPIQSFQWADYSVKPNHDYTYTIVALYDDPAHLNPRSKVDISVKTEVETGPIHSAFFNRGSAATQEYTRRFKTKKPSIAGPEAYQWLSRGLLEAMIGFINRAGPGWAIHSAVYEFQWPDVLNALKQAALRGAVVKVLYDNIVGYYKNGKPKGPWQANQNAIQKANIQHLCFGRDNGELMHNKFFVLSQNGTPQAVWTGSTNLTENGIFGHSNVGHIVEDETIAQAYLDYWHRLEQDSKVDKLYRNANVLATPAPPNPWSSKTTVIFSPRKINLDSLQWYADLAGSAKGALFMTFAFGMHEKFRNVYLKNDQILRMALLEKDGNSAKEKQEIQNIRNRPNVVLALGNRIVTNSFDRWLAEMAKIVSNVYVYWIHTKYMLIDPLGADPIVVSGSANFSKASTYTNDENMLVIKGDKRISDIYFGEFLRLYNHHAFREAVKRYMAQNKANKPNTWQPQYLIDDDKWMAPYFNPNDPSGRYTRRKYFADPMVIN